MKVFHPLAPHCYRTCDQIDPSAASALMPVILTNAPFHSLFQDERARIDTAGGIIRQSRVNGVLAVSRSFGDVEHKGMAALMPSDNKGLPPTQQNVVIAAPEITCEAINSSCEFIVMASDGLWDVLSSQQVSRKSKRYFAAPYMCIFFMRALFKLNMDRAKDL